MRKTQDRTIKILKEELKAQREDNKVFGRSDYRRGYMDALRQMIEVRKIILDEERERDGERKS